MYILNKYNFSLDYSEWTNSDHISLCCYGQLIKETSVECSERKLIILIFIIIRYDFEYIKQVIIFILFYIEHS